MSVAQVSKQLKEEAMRHGLCFIWTNDWGSPTMEQLVDMYIRGLDFCILNNYPSNEYIKQNFGKLAEKKGIYTDTKVELLNPPIAIINGDCKGEITLTGYTSSDIHIRHKSKVRVVIRDNAKAFIRVYDDANVVVENKTCSRSYLYMKGGTASISGKMKVRSYELKDGDWVEIED